MKLKITDFFSWG